MALPSDWSVHCDWRQGERCVKKYEIEAICVNERRKFFAKALNYVIYAQFHEN